MGTVRETLQEIAAKQAFDKLTPFRDVSTWDRMEASDRELLALLFVAEGEQQLKSGEEAVLQTFAMASQAAPSSAQVYYRQGLAWAAKTTHGHCLLLACQSFEKAVELQRNLFEVWLHWGETLTHLGVLYAEGTYMREAEERFQEAEAQAQTPDERARLAWKRGRSCAAVGKLSGEAYDYRMALDKFSETAALGIDVAPFWSDYGQVFLEFALLMPRRELLQQAANLLRRAVQVNPKQGESWFSLAIASQHLYFLTGERAFFIEADRAFKQASGSPEVIPDLWRYWGQLQLGYGKLSRDLESLRSAMDKFEKANALLPNNGIILTGWAEAQLLVGSYTERLDLLREAQRKSLTCLVLMPDNPRVLYLCGICLNELGRYFAEEAHYISALERFKQGLALKNDDPLLWYGLAQAYFSLGDIRRDRDLLEKSVSCCSQVVDCGGDCVPQFYNDWGVALMKLAEMTSERSYVEAAVEKFELALVHQIRGSDASNAEAESLDAEWLYNYGCALDFLGDFTDEPHHYEKAIQVLSQVIILDPDYSHARYNLALAFSHLGELICEVDCFHKSSELFQTIVENDPEDEAAWIDWGVALINLSQLLRDPSRPDMEASLLDQAEAKLSQAAALGNTHVYYHLACIYSLHGNNAVAQQYVERAEAAGSLPPLEEIAQDEWLEGLRQTEEFRLFMHQISSKNGETF